MFNILGLSAYFYNIGLLTLTGELFYAGYYSFYWTY